jgi:hypothetical protein
MFQNEQNIKFAPPSAQKSASYRHGNVVAELSLKCSANNLGKNLGGKNLGEKT